MSDFFHVVLIGLAAGLATCMAIHISVSFFEDMQDARRRERDRTHFIADSRLNADRVFTEREKDPK